MPSPRIARAVHAAGLHVPAVGEIVEVDGRLGLIYERVDGVSMAETAKAKPWTLFRFARLLAELQADMHASPVVPELPSQRQRLEQFGCHGEFQWHGHLVVPEPDAERG